MEELCGEGPGMVVFRYQLEQLCQVRVSWFVGRISEIGGGEGSERKKYLASFFRLIEENNQKGKKVVSSCSCLQPCKSHSIGGYLNTTILSPAEGKDLSQKAGFLGMKLNCI